MTTRLLYVADPMCSWCFGFAPVLARVRRDLAPHVELHLVLGGLAPDSEEPMPETTRRYVQQAWREVEARSGARFEWSYWDRCQPRRSTWPACRAVLAAGAQGEAMFEAIQRAYYREARDPSDRAVLVELGAQLGFEAAAFVAAIDAPETRDLLAAEFELRDRLGASGYPSLGLERDGELRLLTHGWIDEAPLRELFSAEGLLIDGEG